MAQASERPRRKRLSWESRCEIVAMIEAGSESAAGRGQRRCSRATGYRLWQRYREGGWAALRDRPSTPRRQPRRLSSEAEQAILAARRRSAYGPVRLAGLVPHPPSTIGKVLRRHGCSRLPRPQRRRPLRPPLRARAAGRAAARRHQAARPLLGAGQARARRAGRPTAAQPARRLAAPARGDRRPLAARLRRAAARPGRRELRPLPRARGRLVPRAAAWRSSAC